ncbi:AAA family ATPase [Microbispora hainanensis]|uniref:AAA family ATPase n=1 Tax=Microbispora hainanensis TaxID=568844 RepID=UPI001ABF07AA|nr:AAA family ATPase [Microbispora hainanensis]
MIELPEATRKARYDRLVGLDAVKRQLRKEAILLSDPERLHTWARRHHPGADPAALQLFADRAPLFVFAGDVGSGKSALAESFGCDLSEQLDLPVYLYRLKLATRGSGLVGEMTALIGDAFSFLHNEGRRARNARGVSSVLILVVDEADALVQSREAQQMHHEDRAGVDAFLAGVDSLAGARLPVLVVLCTNRVGALDPAVMRRAAANFTFARPDSEQRRAVLAQALQGISVRADTLDKLVELTGPTVDRPGYTFSDLTQRLIPAAVLQAFPDGPVRDEHLLTLANELAPSPVFTEGA